MQKHIEKTLNLALVVFFVALIGVPTFDSGAFAQMQTSTTAKAAELESAAEAKRGLATIGSRDYKRVKDPKVRDAGTRALAALKKVAKNASKPREAALMADLDRSVKALKLTLPQHTSGGIQECDKAYDTCMELCKATGACDLCSGNNLVCYIVKLTIELVQEKDPSKNP